VKSFEFEFEFEQKTADSHDARTGANALMHPTTAARIGEPYAARSIRFLELWPWQDWMMKVYGLAYDGDEPPSALVAAAKHAAAGCLPRPARTATHYGVGFIGVHAGRGEHLVFVDWWADENELRHGVFVSPAGDPAGLVDVTGTDRIACVWDLAVIEFERRAWIHAVLLDPARPDLDGYLAARFEGRI
jgi:hypothetical protein